MKLTEETLSISGALIIDVMNDFFIEIKDILEKNRQIKWIDMSNVNKVDTSFLAVITNIVNIYDFKILNIPDDLLELAELSYAKKILPIEQLGVSDEK